MGKISFDFLAEKILVGKRIALDSMIFIYLLEHHEKYFLLVNFIFELLEKEKIEAVTSIISPLEVLSTPKLFGRQDQISLYSRFFKEEKNLTIYEIDWKIIERSADFRRAYGLRTPDAIQLATAQIAKATVFFTNDENYKKVLEAKDLPQIYLLSEIK